MYNEFDGIRFSSDIRRQRFYWWLQSVRTFFGDCYLPQTWWLDRATVFLHITNRDPLMPEKLNTVRYQSYQYRSWSYLAGPCKCKWWRGRCHPQSGNRWGQSRSWKLFLIIFILRLCWKVLEIYLDLEPCVLVCQGRKGGLYLVMLVHVCRTLGIGI